jgi:hypothetical protein
MTKIIGAFRNFATRLKSPFSIIELPVIYSTARYSAEVTSGDRNLLVKDTKERLASPLTDFRKLDMCVYIYIFNNLRRAFGSDGIISRLSLFSN